MVTVSSWSRLIKKNKPINKLFFVGFVRWFLHKYFVISQNVPSIAKFTTTKNIAAMFEYVNWVLFPVGIMYDNYNLFFS